ncbi:hypothetical protein LCGC14_1885310 [marine sediment metagenome]|uniref:Uncharacterized protein n=1 Tax=marine sediment metagenome TaxID=412755 RepID=A0A0F9G115_9ZZZZ
MSNDKPTESIKLTRDEVLALLYFTKTAFSHIPWEHASRIMGASAIYKLDVALKILTKRGGHKNG